VSSNDEIVRQYVREVLISERKSRASYLSRGIIPTAAETGVDVMAFIKTAQRALMHFKNAIAGVLQGGYAAFQGIKSVARVGGEAVMGAVTGRQPDYDSIVTDQAAALHKSRSFFNLPDTGLGDRFLDPSVKRAIQRESRRPSLHESSLHRMSLDYLLESEEVTSDREIIDVAITQASAEQVQIPTQDPLATAVGETEDFVPEITDVSQVSEIMKSAAQSDVDRLFHTFQFMMSSNDPKQILDKLGELTGAAGLGSTIDPQALADRINQQTNDNVTVEDVESYSPTIVNSLKQTLPSFFGGILQGSRGKIISDASDMPAEAVAMIRSGIDQVYDLALSRLSP